MLIYLASNLAVPVTVKITIRLTPLWSVSQVGWRFPMWVGGSRIRVRCHQGREDRPAHISCTALMV